MLRKGKPSSLALPARFALAGNVMVWFDPAFTTGATFTGGSLTLITTSSVDDSALSLPVRRSVYVPETENVATVLNDVELTNVTVPGPDTLFHATVTELPEGRPSS